MATEGDPAFSPDGRWLAYTSNESGTNQVYVSRFPPPASGEGGKWQVSTTGGEEPRWSRKGSELVYRTGDQLMAARYTGKGETFTAERPRVWMRRRAPLSTP
jgi:Tol biopolymer transport system component